MVEKRQMSVVIADDAEDIRVLIKVVLERDGRFEVLGETDDAGAAVQLLDQHRPDIATFDLHMDGMSDLSVLPRLHSASAATAIVIVTGTYDPRYDPDLDVADVAGWFTKDKIMNGFADQLHELAHK